MPAAFERAADAVGAADAGRADAEPLELGGGDLVADVERLGDERGLLELLLLDPGERAIGGEAAGGGRGLDQRRIDLRAAQRGLDQRLALLDLAGAGFGRRRQAGEADAVGADEEACGGIARPGDEPEHDQEEDGLEGRGNAESAKPGAIVDEQIAITEKPRRRGQHLRHIVPAPKAPNAARFKARRA